MSGALRGLRNAGLLGTAGMLLVPEAFWMLAGEWTRHCHTVGLASVPDVERDAGRSVPDRWALRGPRAAAAWGAPVVLGDLAPVDLFVPSEAALRTAVQRYGAAPAGGGHAATVTVAPTRLAVVRTFDLRHDQGRSVVHPVFAALDLAADPARGREVLEEWDGPDELPDGTPFHRVW